MVLVRARTSAARGLTSGTRGLRLLLSEEDEDEEEELDEPAELTSTTSLRRVGFFEVGGARNGFRRDSERRMLRAKLTFRPCPENKQGFLGFPRHMLASD